MVKAGGNKRKKLLPCPPALCISCGANKIAQLGRSCCPPHKRFIFLRMQIKRFLAYLQTDANLQSKIEAALITWFI